MSDEHGPPGPPPFADGAVVHVYGEPAIVVECAWDDGALSAVSGWDLLIRFDDGDELWVEYVGEGQVRWDIAGKKIAKLKKEAKARAAGGSG